MSRRAEIRAALLALAAERERSFCPSEAARRLASDWRPLMDDVRAEAGRLSEEGRLVATQKGAPVDPCRARGPIRLSRAGR